MTEHYAEIDYGFEWGASKITRCFSDEKKGWVTLLLTTKKYPRGLQIYVTKTGKVRIHSEKGEWLINAQEVKHVRSTNSVRTS